MRAEVVTRCEVYMTNEEQKMLNKVVDWIEETLNDDDNEHMPEGIVRILDDIYEDINHLLELIPDEH